MAHVSIGQILGTNKWRARRDGTSHDCETEAGARAMAKALATGGLQIVETTFAAPTSGASGDHGHAALVLWIAKQTVPELTVTLATGALDAYLPALDVAEFAARNRVSARKAIQARVDAAAGE